MDTVIKVENLSKRYRLGLREKQAETLAGQVANLIKSPWENLKRLREMSRFDFEDESVFWALKDINFEVKEGEVLGIIGNNGAGKSTLLKILSQITDPTGGRIEIKGRVASLLEVGTGFHPELSGRENIYMNGTILGMTKREIDSKLDEIIDFSGIDKFIDTAVKFYSSGMKVRLGFSVAAHLEPEILIIDEVLAVGDYEFQRKCLGKMEDVSVNYGRTVLFVSHDLIALKMLCKTTLLLENGQVAGIGSTSNILSRYLKVDDTDNFEKGEILYSHRFLKSMKSGITKVCVFSNGIPTRRFAPNSLIEIRVDFNLNISDRIETVGIVIKDYNDVELVTLNNIMVGKKMDVSGINNGSLLISLGKIPLYGNKVFKVDLFLGNYLHDFDRLFDAFRFIVVDEDFYNSRIVVPAHNNSIVLPGFEVTYLN